MTDQTKPDDTGPDETKPDETEPEVSESEAPEPEDTGEESEKLEEPEEPEEPAEVAEEQPAPAKRRLSGTSVLAAVLVGLLGFTFAVQVRSVDDDSTAAAVDQEDLVRILANLDAHEQRLRDEIRELEDTHTRLTTAGQSQQEALAEAARRADELGILAGTLPATGPGVVVTLSGGNGVISAATLLDAIQELRSAGAEAMQVDGAGGASVRVIASTYFVDDEDGIVVDGSLLRGPFRIVAIGEPQTLAPAMHIPGGVVASVQGDGGTVTVQEAPDGVEVSTVRQPDTLEHARPDS
jgi:uncharacterized protein YlxW (UPF0749 family)